jgi:carbon storage regulator
MLVLTRKLGESIVIDDEVVVTVTAVQGSRVKLSLEAPKSRRIMRGEIAGEASPTQHEAQSWSSTGTEAVRATPIASNLTHAK